MNFNFGEVLSRAWQIAWKHKGLLVGWYCGQPAESRLCADQHGD